MRVDLILMKYIKKIISDSTSTTDLINNIIENIEIIKYINIVMHSNVSIQVMNSTRRFKFKH